jgi:hypothetical protein
MAIAFGKQWAQEVADVSNDREYQNALIKIIDPSLVVRSGTIQTGYTYDATNATKWSGQARISSMRSGTSFGGTTSTNPTNIKSMRVQIPYSETFQRVRRGWQVQVVDGGRNDRLTEYLSSVEADVNSSQVAALTFECSIDVESNPNWSL